MADLSTIAYFVLANFFGGIAFSAMGFGMAIVYLFVYQLETLAGALGCCGLKYAVFIQTIGALTTRFLVLYTVGLRKHARLELLIVFLPVQFIGTPLGQFVQHYTPDAVLKLVAGVVIMVVAVWQIANILLARYRCCGTGGGTVVQYTSLDYAKPGGAVYFMIGSQRSGSNWLQLLISERYPGVAVPHPPHILENFFPVLQRFGDLTKEENLATLVDVVCEYVENSPVPMADMSHSVIVWDRKAIVRRCREQPSLISVFEAVMDTYAQVHGCSTWICDCKSMTAVQYHDQLAQHFGNRLRYIYVHRDPRDICMSFKKAPVGDSHYFVISETWTKNQETALRLEKCIPDQMCRISYEAVLSNQQKELDSLAPFFGENENEPVEVDQVMSTGLSVEAQVSVGQNVSRGDSFKAEQICRWSEPGGLSATDILEIEASSFEAMEELGYKPVAEARPFFTEDVIAGFRKLNVEGIERKGRELNDGGAEDWERRDTQEAVLRKYLAGAVIGGDNVEADSDEWVEYKSPNWKQQLKNMGDKVFRQFWPIRPVTCCMLLAGFMSGFLGGLIAVSGPALIIFFLFFEFPKLEIKANGALVGTVNTLVRIATYTLKPPPDAYPTETWFSADDVWLYVAVASVGLVSFPMGHYLSRYLNKSGYKLALAVLLIVNAVTMITTATLDFLNER